MKDLQKLEARINELEKRNLRVEADKKWETSWIRKLSIMILTYLVIVSYLQFVVHINPWINAVVPAVGFFLSTLTLSLFKKYWLSRQ